MTESAYNLGSRLLSEAYGSGAKTNLPVSSVWLNLWPYMIIFAILILAITVIYWTTPPKGGRRKYITERRKNITDYFAIIGSLGIVFVLVALVVADFQRQSQAKQTEVEQIVAQKQAYWNDIEKQFKDDPDLGRLYKQTHLGIEIAQLIPDPPITNEVRRKEIHMVQEMLSIIGNVNLIVGQQSEGWQNPIARTWLGDFRQWLKSQIVQTIWEETKNLYSPETIRFVDTMLLSSSTQNITSDLINSR